MKMLFVLLLATISSFLVFVSAAAGGIIRKSRRLAALAAVALIACGSLAYQTCHLILHKAKSKVANAVKPRAGAEIYEVLFGKGPVACTQVLESQDQVVPRIDIAIWLHFRTCPSEFRRLIARHPFSAKKQATAHWQQDILGAEGEKWFRPQAMGDTVLVYQYATQDNRNIQTFWASRDSTEVFYRDILD